MKVLGPMRVTGKVGFYGCRRLVRVGLAEDTEKPPRTATITCPGCGNEHAVAIAWRQPVDADADHELDLVLDAGGAVVSG